MFQFRVYSVVLYSNHRYNVRGSPYRLDYMVLKMIRFRRALAPTDKRRRVLGLLCSTYLLLPVLYHFYMTWNISFSPYPDSGTGPRNQSVST